MPGRKRNSRSTGGASAAKRSKSKWSSSKFGVVVEGAGLVLGVETQNQLKVHPAIFQRDVANTFKKSSARDGVSTDDFMQSFREYLDDPVRLKNTLMPTGLCEGADVRARFGGLDSLMKMLLGVDVLQPLVIDALLEWMPDYMSDGAGPVGSLDLEEHLLMPKLMLSQLRMLDHLVNGKDLCDKLLEIVEIAPPEMKREIVTALPEILDDPQHDEAAQRLKALLESSTDLTAALLDTLSNLNMNKETAVGVLDAAINSLQSAEVSDLPTVIKFINENLTPGNAKDVVMEVREKLGLDFSPTPIISSTPLTLPKDNSKSSDYFMVLDTIRSCICFHRVMADGWIKAIGCVSSPDDHRVIDVFVLFVLHSITAHRKTVEKMFANKIKAGCFSDDLMNSVFGSHPGALREFFPSILRLCESLFHSTSPTVSLFAASLYQHLFTSFLDQYCRQDVVDALVMHVNNGQKGEVDRALDVLLILLDLHCKDILQFTPLIKTILDYLGHFNMHQVKKIYRVFSILAFADHSSAMQSELHLIIAKQLTHFESRYRHIGVIGSVMMIDQIASSADVCEVGLRDSATQDSLRRRRHEMAQTMLADAMKTCRQATMILFCDEMCGVISHLADTPLLPFLCEETTNSFQDTFLWEVTDGLPQVKGGVAMEFLYGLDTTEEGSIALNLLPMILAAKNTSEGGGAGVGEELVGMAAKFHLLRTCEQQLNGTLEGIDALLGCPVVMCSEKVFQSDGFAELPESQRLDICLSIFYCLNWFRELVCAFAGESDIEMKGKVIMRLQNITDLQDRLETCMAATTGFWPPSVTMADEAELAQSSSRAKSSKNEVTLASMTAATINIEKDATGMDKTPAAPTIPIDRLRPYFRELSLSAFRAFQFGCLSRTILDSHSVARDQEELSLQPSQLIFLLQDLTYKLTHTFSAFPGKGAKSAGDGGSKFRPEELCSLVTELMPNLCEHLENTSAFFQTQLAENDGILDAGGGGSEYPQFCLCFHLLLKALHSFFGWPSLSDPSFSDELKSCLSSILSRLGHSSSQRASDLPHLALGVCKYLRRFSDFLPTLTCAHALSKLMVAICKTCKAVDVRPFISTACGDLLQRPWKAAESTQLKNEAVTFLLKYHIEWARDSLAVVEALSGDAAVDLIGEEAMESSSKYPTLTSATFPWFYRCMMNSLVNQLKAIPVSSKTRQLDTDTLSENFHTLQISLKVFAILVNLVQSFSKRAVLSYALKIGRLYVEAFIKSGMPLLHTFFIPRKEEVVLVLKTLQQSTRFLHHCCGHSKVVKDTTLINHVPSLKKTLETLLFRVKELMAVNNCQEAFWVGNLKNRDLKGQEILSQQSVLGEEEGEERESDDDHDSATTSSKSKVDDDMLDLDSEASDETSMEN